MIYSSSRPSAQCKCACVYCTAIFAASRCNKTICFIKNSNLTLFMIFQVLLGATALTVHETYEKLMNFTFPISVQSYSMMILRPKELSRLYLFIAPFQLDVSQPVQCAIFISSLKKCRKFVRRTEF